MTCPRRPNTVPVPMTISLVFAESSNTPPQDAVVINIVMYKHGSYSHCTFAASVPVY